MWDYIKYSNLKFSVDLNPFCWGFKWMYQEPTKRDPHLRMQYVRFLFLSMLIIIDNGFYYIDATDEIEVVETKADPL